MAGSSKEPRADGCTDGPAGAISRCGNRVVRPCRRLRRARDAEMMEGTGFEDAALVTGLAVFLFSAPIAALVAAQGRLDLATRT